MNTSTSATSDRREHRQVREIFVHACELLAPIVDGKDTHITFSNFAMTRLLQEHFPELTAAEIRIVIVTVEKLQREKKLQALLK
jgi:hypothetical protein